MKDLGAGVRMIWNRTGGQRRAQPRPRSRPLLLTVAFVFAACAHAPTPAASEPLDVMSFNVRYGTAPDGPHAWPLRRTLVFAVIDNQAPELLGVQEALRFQLDEIRAAHPHFAEIGVGRDDGVQSGEYTAILYDAARLEVLDSGTFWLSDSPTTAGSMTWGNRYPRTVTWARMLEHGTDRTFLVVNTHWDHESQEARVRSADQISSWLATHAAGQPVIVMGDFNAGPSNPAFRSLRDAGVGGASFRDTFAELHPGAGLVGTYHAYEGNRSGERIDAILISAHWDLLSAAIDTTYRDGLYPSDHFPVTATMRLRPR